MFVPCFVVHCFLSFQVHEIILMEKKELIALLCLSSSRRVIVI